MENPNNKEEFRIIPEYNFYSPYVQMYMQALAVRPPVFFPTPTYNSPYGNYGAPQGQSGGAPVSPYGGYTPYGNYGGYDPYGMQPGQPAMPANPQPAAAEPPVIRRRVRQKAVILFAGLFALVALALSAFFFYINGDLISKFFEAFEGVSKFDKIFGILGENVTVLLILGAAVFGLGALISAIVGLCSKKWQPVIIFTILAFLAYAAACILIGKDLIDFKEFGTIYPYYCVAAAYLFSMVFSWFCYPKRKYVLQEI